jgi:transcriptional regulator with XRE-family HTH domain
MRRDRVFTGEPMTKVADQEYRVKVGSRVREARIRRGLTTKDLANTLGASSPRIISAYETGTRMPPPESWLQLSRVLEVSLDWLLGAKESDLVAATFFQRDQEKKYLDEVERWERTLQADRRTAPPLFDSWILLPEVMSHQHKLRRGTAMSEDDQELHRQRAEARCRRFEQEKWTVWELWARDEVRAFIQREGPYGDGSLDEGLVRAQIEHVVAKMERWKGRYLVALTPLRFRFAYRVYDDRIAVFNSMANYIVIREPLVVDCMVKEFQSAWSHEENDFNVMRFLRDALEKLTPTSHVAAAPRKKRRRGENATARR